MGDKLRPARPGRVRRKVVVLAGYDPTGEVETQLRLAARRAVLRWVWDRGGCLFDFFTKEIHLPGPVVVRFMSWLMTARAARDGELDGLAPGYYRVTVTPLAGPPDFRVFLVEEAP